MKKTMLTFTGILLFFAAIMVALPAQAQTTADEVADNSKPVEGYTLTPADYKVGDTIYICKDSLRYLTGERMSKWVYAVPHVIRQLGGKTHPNGVLVAGINSWVYPATAMAVHPRYETQAQADAKAAEVAKTDTVLAPAAEPAPVEPAPVDTVPVQEQPVEEPAQPVAEEPAPVETPVQTADSVKPATTHHSRPQQNLRDMSIQERYNKAKLGTVNRFSIGVRGGVASYMPDVDYDWGFDAMFDVQYAHYWTLRPKQCRIGFLVGVGAGYMQSGIKNYLNYSYDTKDGEGRNVHYTVNGYVQETDRQWMLQVPVMFSMVAPNGFFLNVGPTFMLPVSTSYKQTVTDPSITMSYWGVDITDQKITGVLPDDARTIEGSNAYNRFKLNILVGAELGHDFQFSTGNSLGLGVYFNYGAYSAYKPVSATTPDDPRAADVIHITPADGTGADAKVEVQPLMGTTNRIGYFDVGLKLAYHFNLWR